MLILAQLKRADSGRDDSQLNSVDVSRETLDDLRPEALVRKWTPKINLVSKAAIDELWDRHIVDSVQLNPASPG